MSYIWWYVFWFLPAMRAPQISQPWLNQPGIFVCFSAEFCVVCVMFLSGLSWSCGICKKTTQVKYSFSHSPIKGTCVFLLFRHNKHLCSILMPVQMDRVPKCSCQVYQMCVHERRICMLGKSYLVWFRFQNCHFFHFEINFFKDC